MADVVHQWDFGALKSLLSIIPNVVCYDGLKNLCGVRVGGVLYITKTRFTSGVCSLRAGDVVGFNVFCVNGIVTFGGYVHSKMTGNRWYISKVSFACGSSFERVNYRCACKASLNMMCQHIVTILLVAGLAKEPRSTKPKWLKVFFNGRDKWEGYYPPRNYFFELSNVETVVEWLMKPPSERKDLTEHSKSEFWYCYQRKSAPFKTSSWPIAKKYLEMTMEEFQESLSKPKTRRQQKRKTIESPPPSRPIESSVLPHDVTKQSDVVETPLDTFSSESSTTSAPTRVANAEKGFTTQSKKRKKKLSRKELKQLAANGDKDAELKLKSLRDRDRLAKRASRAKKRNVQTLQVDPVFSTLEPDSEPVDDSISTGNVDFDSYRHRSEYTQIRLIAEQASIASFPGNGNTRVLRKRKRKPEST